MINVPLYHHFLYIVYIADKSPRFKFAILSHSLSYDFVYVVIAIIEKSGKLPEMIAIREQ